jgi:chaperonin GroES
MEVKKGDKIIFQKYGGHEMKVEGVELMILREEDVMAIVE